MRSEKNSILKSLYFGPIFLIDSHNGTISMVHAAQDAGFKSRAAKAFLLGYTNSQGKCTVQCSDEIYYCALLHQYGIYMTSEA